VVWISLALLNSAEKASIQNVIMGSFVLDCVITAVFRIRYGILQLLSLIITKGDHRLSSRGGLPDLLYTTVPMALDYGKITTKLSYLLSSPPRLDRPKAIWLVGQGNYSLHFLANHTTVSNYAGTSPSCISDLILSIVP
jgi:hypothetical protein